MCWCEYLSYFMTINAGMCFCLCEGSASGSKSCSSRSICSLVSVVGVFWCFWVFLWMCFGCISSLDLRTHEKKGMKEESVNKRRLKSQENSAISSTSACQEEIKKETFGRSGTHFYISIISYREISFHFISHGQIAYCSLVETNMMRNYVLKLQFDWLLCTFTVQFWFCKLLF